jgi:hypothetical protein
VDSARLPGAEGGAGVILITEIHNGHLTRTACGLCGEVFDLGTVATVLVRREGWTDLCEACVAEARCGADALLEHLKECRDFDRAQWDARLAVVEGQQIKLHLDRLSPGLPPAPGEPTADLADLPEMFNRLCGDQAAGKAGVV